MTCIQTKLSILSVKSYYCDTSVLVEVLCTCNLDKIWCYVSRIVRYCD